MNTTETDAFINQALIMLAAVVLFALLCVLIELAVRSTVRHLRTRRLTERNDRNDFYGQW